MLNVLTYDHPHRRTADLLMRLAAAGHQNVRVLALPWVERKSHVPLVWHRPPCYAGLEPYDLTINLGFEWVESTMAELPAFIAEAERTLIGGADILPREVVKAGVIVNAHQGGLPDFRGMDTLKWMILARQEPEVTTYQLAIPSDVSDHVDAGWIIEGRRVSIGPLDTFHAVAWKTYDLEVQMLLDAVDAKVSKRFLHPTHGVCPRMKHAQEVVMLRRFEGLVG